MNEYAIHTTGRSVVLQWFAESSSLARKEAISAGHAVSSIRLVREDLPSICPGVICRCDDPEVNTCPMHGKKSQK